VLIAQLAAVSQLVRYWHRPLSTKVQASTPQIMDLVPVLLPNPPPGRTVVPLIALAAPVVLLPTQDRRAVRTLSLSRKTAAMTVPIRITELATRTALAAILTKSSEHTYACRNPTG